MLCTMGVSSKRSLRGTAQLVAVVDAAAEHQLAVDGDAALHQTGQVLEHLAAALVGQHPHTELRVRGVHRNVDGRDVHLDDAVDLVVLHVRHGDIVAEQKKGQTLVVVLEIQRLSQAAGDLVHKAEHAFVAAGVLLVAPDRSGNRSQRGRAPCAAHPTRGCRLPPLLSGGSFLLSV